MRLINPEGLPTTIGFSHVVLPGDGKLVFLAGQAGMDADGLLAEGLVAQFEQACRNVAIALAAVDARPEHVASLQIFTTDVVAYRASLSELGPVYRSVFGRHYPAIALLGVAELFDPAALVELVVVAVIPG
jgi:enamine deaminase RidA (YjgF/YER057c/UK114 family)